MLHLCRAHGGARGRGAVETEIGVGVAIGHGIVGTVVFIVWILRGSVETVESTILERCPGPLENLDQITIIVRLGGGPEIGHYFGLLETPPTPDWPHTSSDLARV